MLRAYQSIETAWDRLSSYLGDRFDDRLKDFGEACAYSEREAEHWRADFYQKSNAYLYELTHFHFSGFKDAFFELMASYAADHGIKRLADIGCGVGLDGQALLQRGFQVDFYDLGGPANEYLAWRLKRELAAETKVRPIGRAENASHELAYLADVVEHADDPLALLGWAGAQSEHLALNLFPHERRARAGFEMHYPLDHEAIHGVLDATHRLMRCAICGDTVAQIWRRR
jgi:hypothetical protein